MRDTMRSEGPGVGGEQKHDPRFARIQQLLGGADIRRWNTTYGEAFFEVKPNGEIHVTVRKQTDSTTKAEADFVFDAGGTLMKICLSTHRRGEATQIESEQSALLKSDCLDAVLGELQRAAAEQSDT